MAALLELRYGQGCEEEPLRNRGIKENPVPLNQGYKLMGRRRELVRCRWMAFQDSF